MSSPLLQSDYGSHWWMARYPQISGIQLRQCGCLSRHYKSEHIYAMFTRRVGQGGYMALPGVKTEPLHLSWGNAREISVAASWMRGSTQSCCATPLIPENDVIMLKVSATPIPNPLSLSHAHTHTYTSADLFVVVECVKQRGGVWTDGHGSWLTG